MNTRFRELIIQRNREELEKLREYYSAHKEENPAMLRSIEETLAGTAKHNLRVYGTEYFLNFPDMMHEIRKPIFNGIDLDDLFYYFDPDYVLSCIDQMPRRDIEGTGFGILDVLPVLLILYAKHEVLTAAGFDSATSFDITVLDNQIETELLNKKYNCTNLYSLAFSADTTTDIKKTSLFIAVLNAYESLAESVPKLQALGMPKRHYVPNTYLSNALMGTTEKGEFIGIGGRNFQTLKNRKSYFRADWIGQNIRTSGKPWLEFDRSLNNAVCTLFMWAMELNLPPIFTTEMICRAANGKDSTYTVTPQMVADADESLAKQRSIMITIDATEELKARHINLTYEGRPIEGFSREETALQYGIIEIKVGGVVRKAYDFTGNKPIMLKYAELNGELLTFGPELLDIKSVSKTGKIEDFSAVPLTKQRMAVRDYMLRRWKTIKRSHDSALEEYARYRKRCQLNKKPMEYDLDHFLNNKKLVPIILFDTMFSNLQITDKNSKTNCKKFALDVLNYWKALGKLNYTTRKKGKTIDAIQIVFD